MIAASSHAIVSDDLRMEINKKYTIVGMYTGSIAIPIGGFVVPQLVVTFISTTDLEKPFSSLILEVTLPDTAPIRQEVAVASDATRLKPGPGTTLWVYRTPMFLRNVALKPGPFRAKIVTNIGEFPAYGLPLIVVAPGAFGAPAPKAKS
jgi:hypothetical protein